MKESRNNRKWLGVIALAAMVAIVMSGCKKDEAQAYMGHEVIFTDCVGATYGTSELLCDLGREEVTEDIYFERGVYWCRGEAANDQMENAVNNLKKMWKENGGESFLTFGLASYNSKACKGGVKDGTKTDSIFNDYDVQEYGFGYVDILERFDSIPGVTLGENSPLILAATRLLHEFVISPSYERYQKTRMFLAVIFVKVCIENVNIDIDNINDLPQLAGTLLQLNAIVSLFQEYDVKFNYKGNGSFN